MFDKRVFLILVLLLIIGTISSVSASDLTTEFTDKLATDEGDIAIYQSTDTEILKEIQAVDSNREFILKETQNTFKDLNNLINGNSDSEVYLNCNYTFDPNVDVDFKEGINISRVVTIWGNGYTLNGNNSARIFSPTNADVIVRDIVFINGKTVDNGGAIDGKCTSINCTFISNSALGYGGAVSQP